MKTIRITILHTNDMHAHLDAMARLSTLISSRRRELEAQGRLVFRFDAGDAADRRERFIGVSKGAAFPPILGAMGCQLQALGNAIGVTYGPKAVAAMAARYPFPLLAANLFEGETPLLSNLQASATFPLPGGLRLGVVGMTIQTTIWRDFFAINQPEAVVAARFWLDRLKAQGEGPLVVLSHMGLHDDCALAQALPQIDVIIGGHSHDLLSAGLRINGVLIAQARHHAQHYGQVDLTLDAETGAVLEKRASVHPIQPVPLDTPPDPAVLAAIAAAKTEGERLMAQPVAQLTQPLPLDHFAECPLGNLAADALRERMGAEIGVITSGMFHAGLPAGTVTLGDLDACCFSTANPQLSRISGAQLLTAIKRALQPERVAGEGPGFRGNPLGVPCLSGLRVHYRAPDYGEPEILLAEVNREPLDPAHEYLVAHTDAEVIEEFAPHGGCLALQPGQLLRTEVPTIVREVLADYLKVHEPAPAPQMGRLVRQ